MSVHDAEIVARGVHFAAMIMLEGAIVYRLFVLSRLQAPQADALRHALRPWLAWIAGSSLTVGVVSGAAWLVLLAARIAAVSVADAVWRGAALTVITSTQFGADWLIRSALAFALIVLLLLPNSATPRSWRDGAAALLAACLLGGLAWAGHGASTLGAVGDVQLAGDVLHLVASGVWLGGLLPFAVTLVAARRQGLGGLVLARSATTRFSMLALAGVVVLFCTGIVNTYVLAGSVPALLGTPYGRLLIVKIALFAAMVCVAAINRRRLTPALVKASDAIGARTLWSLARNSLVEFVLGLGVIAAVAVLGTMTPGLHDQPVWPLSFRIVFDLKTEILLGLLVLAVVAVLAFARYSATSRWPVLLAAAAAIPFCVPVLLQSVQPAYPTTYWSSPTGYAATSILKGHRLFLANCSACHGVQGRGDGPAAAGLKIPPADLTADHVYSHLDGDMFWWIGNGLGGVMPPFGAVLDEQSRWNVIDFIYANADAVRLRAAAGRVTATGYPVPRFSAECPDGSIVATDRLKGQALHILFADSDANLPLQRIESEPKTMLPIVVATRTDKLKRGCIARAPEALRLGRFYAQEAEQGPAASEWLVDAHGLLRALWSPGHGEPWTDPAVLRQRVQALGQAAAPIRGLAASAHHH
jgi:putative copper export protein/mono/diheme cytochrome c family protein